MILRESLKLIKLEDGNVLQFIKKTDNSFSEFGEAYFSYINYNRIKGWKKHHKMTMNLVVPFGLVKFVFFDKNKKFLLEEIIGPENYYKIQVPPGYWYAFKGLSNEKSLICNLANIIHDDGEVEKIALEEIQYNWSL